MPYLQLQDRQFPLSAGESTIGAYEGAAVRLPGSDSEARAVVTVSASGLVIRRANPTSVVLVNGVQLGVEPSPLLHGDRVEIGGHELRVGEDQKGGSTQFVSASEIAAVIAGGASPRKPTMATGGRLVSLVDGREYTVVDAGITFGREVGHDVVIASSEISRRHASIAPGPDGYVLTDHSTNGIWVNGQRMGDAQVLGRGDVIKMGTEEFRFYADVAKAAPAAAAAAPVSAAPIAAPAAAADPVAQVAPAPVAPAPVVAAPVAAAPVATPATVAPVAAPARAPVAVLEVIAEGPLKGRKFELHSALTNIGRGDHNDIALKDESVSDSHAKLQKRGDGWWIVDQGSTNGTYVGGRRVQSEQRIEGAPDLRFGGIKMNFRAAAAPMEDGSGTRAIAAVNVDAARRAAASRTPSLAKVPAAVVSQERKKGCATMIAFFFVTLAGAGASLLGLLLYVGR